MKKFKLERVEPADIERRSFEIIAQELGERRLDPDHEAVIKRAIHTTADFDYADNLLFSAQAVQRAVKALRDGAHIVTDTQMAASGVNRRILHALGGQIHCFMSDGSVAEEAKRRGITRATICMERAAELTMPLIIAVGNAPTALVRLYELIAEGRIRPELVIGVPVGFVNVVEAKELIMTADVPFIVARGRKGGSNVAAAICNALLLLAEKDEEKKDEG
ncbi:MAG: precorrin-8X methylmutase [Paenibacillaceae bacterium]|jgi:precorrin-8X/cobalt-precorrin-8 methylmutase|nr:precorrin-8X methylmutase [Paenibacillaceae bacterium]